MKSHVLCLLLLAAGPAGAVDYAGGGPALHDLGPAREAIAAGDWKGALSLLAGVVAEDPGNAYALNLMGYASRRAGDLGRAASYYRAALSLELDHRGALEYQGELFLRLGDGAAAEANLARLTALCGDFEEREDLAAALAGE